LNVVRSGERAPEFTLDGVEGDGLTRRSFALDDYRGQLVVAVFYPADNSPVCTAQLRSYTEDIGAFARVGAQVLAISPQSVDDHAQFAQDNGGFAFPLLADVDKDVARAYGILGPIGFYRRSVYVIDGGGVVQWAQRRHTDRDFGKMKKAAKRDSRHRP
jgi:peroxiredoxin Q/BCP